MDRETKELTLSGHTLTVKTYATAREAHAIQQAYFKGAKIEVIGAEPKFSDFDPGVQFEVYQELIRQIVLSLDGSAEGIVERAVELPNDVFDELVTALDQIVSKKKS